MLKILYGNPIWGVADGYSLSRPHGNLRNRDIPAVRDGESADTVVIDGDVLGGNAVLLFRVVHVDMVNQLQPQRLDPLGGFPLLLYRGDIFANRASLIFWLTLSSYYRTG